MGVSSGAGGAQERANGMRLCKEQYLPPFKSLARESLEMVKPLELSFL